MESIARNGHVGQLLPSGDPNVAPGHLRYELVGINEASTFAGLCNRHDSELFRPIETIPITFTSEQMFLLGYRALMRECYTKRQAIHQLEFMRSYGDHHPDIKSPFYENYLSSAELGNRHGQNALLYHKGIYDDVWRNNNFSKIRFVAFLYDSPTPILSASAFAPEYDFTGGLLQDLSDLSFTQNSMSLCIWSVDSCGVVLLMWHETSDRSCVPFVRSLLRQPKPRLSARLTSLAFEHSENIAFSPYWWEALSPSNRLALERRMKGGLISSEPRQPDYLHDEGCTAISARVNRVLEHFS